VSPTPKRILLDVCIEHCSRSTLSKNSQKIRIRSPLREKRLFCFVQKNFANTRSVATSSNSTLSTDYRYCRRTLQQQEHFLPSPMCSEIVNARLLNISFTLFGKPVGRSFAALLFVSDIRKALKQQNTSERS
jgi:hypothetical protein